MTMFLKRMPLAVGVMRSNQVMLKKIIAILAGRQHPRKLTTEIINFAKTRFFSIYPKNHYSYSKVIRQEILDVFEITISGECLRSYFSQWKDCLQTQIDSPLPANEESSQNSHEQSTPVIENRPDLEPLETHNTDIAGIEEQTENNRVSGNRNKEMALPGDITAYNRNHAVVYESKMLPSNAGYRFCHHAGILLFSQFFNHLKNNITVNEALINLKTAVGT